MSTYSSFDFDPLEDWSDDLAETDQVTSPSPASIKFGLFLKVREIKELASIVQNLQTRSLAERQAWLEANETLVFDLINDFTDSSLAKLQGVATDQESVMLSVDLVTSLRQTLLSLDGLMSEPGESFKRRVTRRLA